MGNSDEGFTTIVRKRTASKDIVQVNEESDQASQQKRSSNSSSDQGNIATYNSKLHGFQAINKFAMSQDLDVHDAGGRFIPQDTDYRIRMQISDEQSRKEQEWQSTKARLENRMRTDMEKEIRKRK